MRSRNPCNCFKVAAFFSHEALSSMGNTPLYVPGCRIERITTEALNGDQILVDGDQGIVHLRPEETVARAFRDKIAMQAEAQKRYASLRNLPATTLCGTTLSLHMNAGLMAAGILALSDPALAQRLEDWRDSLSASIPEEPQDD